MKSILSSLSLYLHADDRDYQLSANLSVIYIGESEACVTVHISDDQFIEDTEYFTLIPSSFDPNDIVVGDTTVMISDNDGMCGSTIWLMYYLLEHCFLIGAFVQLENSTINVTEGDGPFQVCVTLYSPTSEALLQRPVKVILTLESGVFFR